MPNLPILTEISRDNFPQLLKSVYLRSQHKYERKMRRSQIYDIRYTILDIRYTILDMRYEIYDMRY